MSWFSKWRTGSPDIEAVGHGVEAGDRPVFLHGRDPTDKAIRAAVAQWIALMARGDYELAVKTVFTEPPEPEEFREQVETFCVGLQAMRQGVVDAFRREGMDADDPPPLEAEGRAQVVPAPKKLLKSMEIERQDSAAEAAAVIGFHLPLDNNFAIWTTMGIVRDGDRCVLEFDMFHL